MATSRPARLLVEERRRRIVELLDQQERATVDEIVDRFGVSAVTVRGDFDALAEAGLLVRSHGGALRRIEQRDVPISVKEKLHHDEKVRIGQAAARLVRPGETIILDSGTTTVELARRLKHLQLRPVTVITNALNIAIELANLPHIHLIMIGGILRQMSYSTVGPQAEQMLKGLNADRLFLGVDGLDPEAGLTTPDVLEAQLNSLMIRVSREVTVVTDSSKFFRRSLSRIAGVSDVQRLVTDDKADPPLLADLRARGIEVVVV
jgi:DeoR family transcriptional regulator, aga operon transcriptional repressor